MFIRLRKVNISLPEGPGASDLRIKVDSKMPSNTKDKPDSSNNNEKKDNKLVIALVVVLVFVVAILAGVVIYFVGRDKKDDTNGRAVAESVRTVIDAESASDVVGQMREQVEEGMFACKMSMKWTFEDGSSESQDAYVANSESNTHPIYFDVYLDDSDEPIYSSPILPVGTSLTNFKLDRQLSKGEYRATVMYTLIDDVDSQQEISKAGFVIQITVLN